MLHGSLPTRTGQSRASPLMRIRQSRSAASSPDENQAELLRRVAPDEKQAKSLCTSLLMRIAAASPRCSARYENRVTPPTPYKTIPPSGLTGKNDTPETIPTDFPRKCHRRGQTNNLPRGKMRSKSRRRKQTAKIVQKQRFIFLFYHTKAGKATGRNANMQFVYTAGQAEKQSTVA